MEQHELQPKTDQSEQDPPVEERRRWQQPTLERLHVSLDTTNSKGSGSDGTRSTIITG